MTRKILMYIIGMSYLRYGVKQFFVKIFFWSKFDVSDEMSLSKSTIREGDIKFN